MIRWSAFIVDQYISNDCSFCQDSHREEGVEEVLVEEVSTLACSYYTQDQHILS